MKIILSLNFASTMIVSKNFDLQGDSESLIKWSEIQTVIISHIYIFQKIPGEQRFEDIMHFGPPYNVGWL